MGKRQKHIRHENNKTAISQLMTTRMQGTVKTAQQRKTKNKITIRMHNRSTALERSVKILEEQNMLNGTNIALGPFMF